MTSILYITTTFPTEAWFLENEVRLLERRGFRIQVVTLRPPSTSFQPEHADLLRITRSMGSPWSPAAWGAVLYWLFKRPLVLVGEVLRMCWASRASAYAFVGHVGYVPAAARIARLVEREGIEHVHGAWAHFPGSVAYLVSRLTSRPFSLSAHAGADVYRDRAFLAHKLRAARFTTACVRANAEVLSGLGGPQAVIVPVYHGVDLARFDGRERQRSEQPVLLTVGRLAPAKGFDTAIRALAALRQRGWPVRLVMVGDGPLRASLHELASGLGVGGDVEMVGFIDAARLLPLYRSAWMLVMPCVELANGRRDGIPNVVVEAMAMGVPCAGTRAAGLEEIVTQGETGVLGHSGDPDELADQIEPLLRNPAELDAMGARARARVVEEFDAERNILQVVELLRGGKPPA
jgi:glycosyltransferase involved in cell wall biosynthesis